MLSSQKMMSAPSGGANYIDDVFSTYLYTGNDSTQTITNGIDLSTKGGLVWIKSRDFADNHNLFDTSRGAGKYLFSNDTIAQGTDTTRLSAFNSTGFSLGNNGAVNGGDFKYVSWTFREQAKFFDVVTYTGNGTAGRTVAHNLGSVPGCIIVKDLTLGLNWYVYHRSTGATQYLRLNATDASTTFTGAWNDTAPTSTVFTVGDSANVNYSGSQYVAYLFAHNAGGFGAAGTDNVISCGSYTGNGSSTGPEINLGYEPQWILVKDSSFAANWQIVDNMRGLTVESDNVLRPNTTAAEYAQNLFSPTATGFKVTTTSSDVNREFSTFIYIAIRRPMKPPTTGTEVFSPHQTTSLTSSSSIGFVDDLVIGSWRDANDGGGKYFSDRLRGTGKYFSSTSTAAESSGGTWNFNTQQYGISGTDTSSGIYPFFWNFRRAPGFFDIVCYTGNGTAGATQNHNLAAVPEMMIVKARDYSGGRPWPVYHSGMGNTKFMYLNATDAETTNTWWNDTTPTSSVFTIGSNSVVNFSGTNYVAYLFATVAGVSKVGSYTGTGSTQQINCGFSGGARFVLIKRTDSTGDWYVWDTARGIVSGNDPYLLLNSTAAEVTSTDYIDPYSAGFEISSTAPAAINANGGSFIFLAIA